MYNGTLSVVNILYEHIFYSYDGSALLGDEGALEHRPPPPEHAVTPTQLLNCLQTSSA